MSSTHQAAERVRIAVADHRMVRRAVPIVAFAQTGPRHRQARIRRMDRLHGLFHHHHQYLRGARLHAAVTWREGAGDRMAGTALGEGLRRHLLSAGRHRLSFPVAGVLVAAGRAKGFLYHPALRRARRGLAALGARTTPSRRCRGHCRCAGVPTRSSIWVMPWCAAKSTTSIPIRSSMWESSVIRRRLLNASVLILAFLLLGFFVLWISRQRGCGQATADSFTK